VGSGLTAGHETDYLSSDTPLSHIELVEAETTTFGMENDLYACRDCLRLRPSAKFGDKMMKRRKRKHGEDAHKRFCVDCGIKPREGTTRYCAGSQIAIQGEHYVICGRCGQFGRGAVNEHGKRISECERCWLFSEAIRQRNDEHHARQEKARLRAEQEIKKAQAREVWGSEYEDSDYDILRAQHGAKSNSKWSRPRLTFT
jgi:hypothetical protein